MGASDHLKCYTLLYDHCFIKIRKFDRAIVKKQLKMKMETGGGG